MCVNLLDLPKEVLLKINFLSDLQMINKRFDYSSINCLNICSKNLTKLLNTNIAWKNRIKLDHYIKNYELCKIISPVKINEPRSLYYQLIKNRLGSRSQ